eukprot:GEMP01033401.1.p1 GENE.GEMP01033401.1~~GEMP01033401.1.p1  ORF type:complete len:288 (+),score=62.31 GEMP01033401.1:35-898(+)
MDPPPDLDTYLDQALHGDVAAQIATLETLRLARLQHPDLALKCGAEVLSSSRGRHNCGNDLWAVYEQVLIAALHLDDSDWYQHCLEVLATQFPNSIRVKRLSGSIQEKKGLWSAAEKLYTDILTDKPSDTTTRKRMIGMLKAQKKTSEAIEECNAYLDIFQTDNDVWHELAELYVVESNYAKASFCFVELVLQNPRNMYAIISYAELQYTLGDHEVARKYFCLATHLDDKNLRALWGLVSCLHAVGNKRDDALNQLFTITKKKLRIAYKPLSELTQNAAMGYLETLA